VVHIALCSISATATDAIDGKQAKSVLTATAQARIREQTRKLAKISRDIRIKDASWRCIAT
jgi:hypothetical protein